MTTADTAREAIAAAGGLLNLTELAERYDTSKTTMHGRAHRPGAPQPLHHNGNSTVYLVSEWDEWMRVRGKL